MGAKPAFKWASAGHLRWRWVSGLQVSKGRCRKLPLSFACQRQFGLSWLCDPVSLLCLRSSSVKCVQEDSGVRADEGARAKREPTRPLAVAVQRHVDVSIVCDGLFLPENKWPHLDVSTHPACKGVPSPFRSRSAGSPPRNPPDRSGRGRLPTPACFRSWLFMGLKTNPHVLPYCPPQLPSH